MGRVGVPALALVVATACGGNAVPPSSPVPTRATTTYPRLSAGHVSTCLVVDVNRVACWGLLETTRPLALPSAETVAPRALGVVGAVQVDGGLGYHCAIDGSGRAMCRSQGADFERIELGPAAVALAVAGERACAIVDGNQVRCWKSGPNPEPSSVPGVENVVGLALGVAHTCALRRDGKVLCWGGNEAGMLGDGTTASRGAPAPVVGLDDVVRIASSKAHTCALRGDGTVHCWGLGDDGQLGDGVKRPRDGMAVRPVQVVGLRDVSAIAVGGAHACALRAGHVFCWGGNGVGQVGDGTTEQRPAPVEVPLLDDVIEIAAGAGHQCALRHDRSVWCWGNGAMGQTGQGPVKTTLRPARVRGL